MHRLLRLSPFKKAREQENHAGSDAPGDSGSSETDRAVTNGTGSHGPAQSETRAINSESNIDVSVLIKALPMTPIN